MELRRHICDSTTLAIPCAVRIASSITPYCTVHIVREQRLFQAYKLKDPHIQLLPLKPPNDCPNPEKDGTCDCHSPGRSSQLIDPASMKPIV